MMWKIAILISLITVAYGTQIEYTKIKNTEINSRVKRHTLSLVIFADEEKDQIKLKELQLQSALKLLKDDLSKINIYITSIGSDTDLKKKYLIDDEPALRIFWNGILMPLPATKNFKGLIIFRWIRTHIRASKISKIQILDPEAFFEEKKEENPFIVIGLGKRNSLEADFLGEFSMIPKTPFKIYLMEDDQSKRIFQSVGLSASKYNILLINNIGKTIKEYTGDLDPIKFNEFLVRECSTSGIFPVKKRVNFIKDTIMLKKNFITLFVPKFIKEYKKRDFREGIRRIAERYDYNFFWASKTREYMNQVDYIDCNLKDEGFCGYIYHDFGSNKLRKRFKFTVSDFEEDTLEVELEKILDNLGEPHHFSDITRPKILHQTSLIQMLSRDTEELLKTSGKDSIILSYYLCGSNCQERINELEEVVLSLTEDSLDKVDFYLCDMRKNEMSDRFYSYDSLNLHYVRKTQPENIIHLQNVNSSFDIIEQIKKHATEQIETANEEDEEFEDLI